MIPPIYIIILVCVAIILGAGLGSSYAFQEQIRRSYESSVVKGILLITGFFVLFSLLMRLITKPDADWPDIAGHSIFNAIFFGTFFYFMTRKDKKDNK